MEQQNKQLAKWQPTRFMTRLNVNTALTMAQMSKFTPEIVEYGFELYRKAIDNLDSLERSERYFSTEYNGSDKEFHLQKIFEEIATTRKYISTLSVPKTIGQLHKENPKMTLDMMALMVNDLRNYFIVDRMITDSGILSLCPMIVVTYPSLTLEELALCLCQAKKGFYGEDFQRMDGSTIMKWIKLYWEDKVQRLMNHRYTQEAGYKAGQEIGRTERGESMKDSLNKAEAALEIEKARKK